MAQQKLYRSLENRMFAGVCGGIGEFFGLDATLIRVAYVALSIFSAGFPGLLLYILLVLIIPERPYSDRYDNYDEVR